MDYSKLGLKRKRRQQNSQSVRIRNKFGLLALRAVLAAILIGISAGAAAIVGAWLGILAESPELLPADIRPINYASRIVCAHTGEELHRLHAGINRTHVTLEQIPYHVRNAFIAIEDERFYYHNGIDIRSIGRAAYRLIASISDTTEGASTITQQLIKNRLERFDSDLTTKLQEQYLAVQFERMLYKDLGCRRKVKDYILEVYLNTINLGRTNHGVQAAALFYYGVDVWDLTIAQAATIAAITQNPSRFPPDRHPEANWERAWVVLYKMHELGFITCEEFEEAVNSNVYDTIVRSEAGDIRDTVSPFDCFIDALIAQVLDDIEEQFQVTRFEANNILFTHGLTIFSTQNRDMQAIVDEVMLDDSLFPTGRRFEIDVTYYLSTRNVITNERRHLRRTATVSNMDAAEAFIYDVQRELGSMEEIIDEHRIFTPQPQAAFVLMDQHNGHVLAIRGLRGERVQSMNRLHCRATIATRSPGSQLKPLIFAAGFDLGLLAPSITIEDRPWAIHPQGGQRYQPRNWCRTYRGLASSRGAISNSMNIVSVRALVEIIGIEAGFSYLQNFGFTTLEGTTANGREWSDRNPSIALGGTTNGVTLVELTAAHATIANYGMYNRPIFYTHILDHSGNLFLENNHAPRQVIRRETAYLVINSMVDTLQAPGATGHRQRFTNRSDIQIAGKTGTSQSQRDSGFVGFTPYFTGAVWLGFDTPRAMTGATAYRENLWRIIMERIHGDLPARSFERPARIVSQNVCRDSGLLPTELCRSDPRGSRVISELFSQNAMAFGSCHLHQQIVVCAVSGLHRGPLCHPNHIENRVGLMLEPLPDFAQGINVPGRGYAFSAGLLEGRECMYCDGTFQHGYDYPEYPYYYDDWSLPENFNHWPWNIPNQLYGGEAVNPYIPDHMPDDNFPPCDSGSYEDINVAPQPHPEGLPNDEWYMPYSSLDAYQNDGDF